MASTFEVRNLPTDRITLFDLKFNDQAPENSVSPWTRLAIYALRVKNLPHHVELVEMVEVPAVSEILGTKPTRTVAPFYTLPAIYDPKTKISLADSLPIVQYLDNQYPETPVLAPLGSEDLTSAFLTAYSPVDKNAFQFVAPKMPRLLEGTKSLAYFRASRTQIFGRDLDTVAPTGDAAAKIWDEIKACFDTVDSWYGERQFVMGGDKPTYPDLMVGGRLWWYRVVFGLESREWQSIASYNNGRWAKLIAYFDGYSHGL